MGTCVQSKYTQQQQEIKCQEYIQQQQQRTQPSFIDHNIQIFNQQIEIFFPSIEYYSFKLNNVSEIKSFLKIYQDFISEIQNGSLEFVNKKIFSDKKQIKQVFKQLKQHSLQQINNYPLVVLEENENEYVILSPNLIANEKLTLNLFQPQSQFIRTMYILLAEDFKILDNLIQYNLQTYKVEKIGNMNFYQLNQELNTNKALPSNFKGHYICELFMDNIDKIHNIYTLRQDFNDGLFLLTYDSLKQHLKRRFFKQYFLWVCFSLKENKIKDLIACSIFVNYLKKQQEQYQSSQIENEIARIAQGGQLYFVWDRVKCLTIRNQLNEEEISYLLSDQIVRDIINRALSNSKLLISCLEQKFQFRIKLRVKQHCQIDTHFFTSSTFIKYTSLIETQQQKKIQNPLISETELGYQWLFINKIRLSNELFLPSSYYTQMNQKFYVPSISILQEWIQFLKDNNFNSQINQEANLLLQIINPEMVMESLQFENVIYQAFDSLLKGYYLENYLSASIDSQLYYEQAIKLSRSVFGDCRNQGSILYPLEAFCWHRLSVFASQKGDEEQKSIIQHFYSQFQDIQLPCNNIQNHQYKNKDLNSVLKASVKGFILQDWFIKLYNEIIGINMETQDSQFYYQPGQILMWGFNQNFQLGQPYQFKYDIPISIKCKKVFIKLKCGYKHTLAICNEGYVYCWGNNEDGKCGIHPKIKYIKTPCILENSKNAILIECGHDHSGYMNKEGTIYTWGCGEGGLLGNNSKESTHIPQQILENAEYYCCGGLHNVAIIQQELYVWGRGEGGQLGLSLDLGFEIIMPTKINISNIIKVACGEAHTIALNDKKQVFGWGYNEQGQLGLSKDNQSVIVPTLIQSDVDNIYAGSLQSYFLKGNSLFVCGCNENGELGFEESQIQGIRELFQKKIDNMAIGQTHALCTSEGKVFGWGSNRFGELSKSIKGIPSVIFGYKVQSLGCGAYHSGVIISGSEKYLPYICDFDYQINV